jgi:HEPN domain-containing protein
MKKLNNGSIFYTTVCCEENRLYSNGNAPVFIPAKQPLLTQAVKARESFNNGYAKAVAFMEGAKIYLGNQQLTMAAFMLHQSIERCLITTIAATTGTAINLHTISELLQHTRRCAWELNEVFPANTEWEKAFLQWVDKLYADAGYKDEFEVLPEYMDILLQRANAILERSHELITRLFIR